jgi:hypothetical protein
MNIRNTYIGFLATFAFSSFVLAENGGLYSKGPNGQWIQETNIERIWHGVWSTDTNGLRTELQVFTDSTQVPWLVVSVGSVTTNSDAHCYCGPPNGKFAKCELRSTAGIVILPKGEALEEELPLHIPATAMPRWENGGHTFKNRIGFQSNSPPGVLKKTPIRSIYKIIKDGEYTLTVCPVMYELDADGQSFKRVNLPCVSANIYLTKE